MAFNDVLTPAQRADIQRRHGAAYAGLWYEASDADGRGYAAGIGGSFDDLLAHAVWMEAHGYPCELRRFPPLDGVA